MGLWARYGAKTFTAAMDDNLRRMRSAIAAEQPSAIADLGCWDGETTARYVPRDSRIVGVEANSRAAKAARSRFGLETVIADLDRPLPLPSATFDVVSSNQVIEHLSDTDRFVTEAVRILKPGGLAVISTENLASWHNIAALLFGWQAFSLTNVSTLRSGIGNPLANFRQNEPCDEGWTHRRVFSYRGLKELLESAGLVDVTILGSGYYPLVPRLAHVDPRHAALVTAMGRKPIGRSTL